MNDYSEIYDPDLDFDRVFSRATARVVSHRVMPQDTVLDLGCATGFVAECLTRSTSEIFYFGVDRSSAYLERANGRNIDNATFILGDIDNLENISQQFDHVLLMNVLHEVQSPVEVLRAAKSRLAAGGLLHVSLQNPSSIHRLAAFDAGMIDSIDEISERGTRFSTRRMLAQDELVDLIAGLGLTIVESRGVFLKPLPNEDLAKLASDQLHALELVAARFPQQSAINYVCATP